MKTQLKPIFASMALLGMVSSPVIAETKTNILDRVVVSATKNEERSGDLDRTVSVIGEDEISQNIMMSVDDLFKLTPSTTVTGDRGASINVRGIEGNRVLITVDGVKQPKLFQFGPLQSSRNLIDINTLKMVEVIPTPSSSVYGSGSVGGIVAYTTKEPSDFLSGKDDQLGGQINLRYDGSNNSFSKSAALAGKSGSTDLMLIFTRHNGEEVENKGKEGSRGADFDKNSPRDFTDTSFLGKINTQLNDNTIVKLTAEQVIAEDDIEAYRTTAPKNEYDDEVTKKRLSAEVIYDKSNMLFDEVAAKFDYQTTDNDSLWSYNFGRGDSTYLGEYDQKDKALTLAFKKQINGSHKLNYGASLERNEYAQNKDSSSSGISRSMPKAEERLAAIYLQDQITVNDKLTITPGIRYDSYTVDPQPDADYLAGGPAETNPEKSTSSKTSLKLGATYNLGGHQIVFGQFAQGFKAPDLDELYTNSERPYEVKQANPDLKPESSDSLEMGHRYDGNRFSTEIVAYVTKYKDFIEEVTIGTEPSPDPRYGTRPIVQKQNLTDTVIRGVEFKGAYDISDDIQLLGAIAYAKGTYKSDSGDTTPLNSVSPLNGLISISYDNPSDKWGTELTINASADKAKGDMEDETEFQSKGYATADFTGYYKFNKLVRLNYGVFNIFDKTYYEWQDVRDQDADNSSNSSPARYFKAGVTIDF